MTYQQSHHVTEAEQKARSAPPGEQPQLFALVAIAKSLDQIAQQQQFTAKGFPDFRKVERPKPHQQAVLDAMKAIHDEGQPAAKAAELLARAGLKKVDSATLTWLLNRGYLNRAEGYYWLPETEG